MWNYPIGKFKVVIFQQNLHSLVNLWFSHKNQRCQGIASIHGINIFTVWNFIGDTFSSGTIFLFDVLSPIESLIRGMRPICSEAATWLDKLINLLNRKGVGFAKEFSVLLNANKEHGLRTMHQFVNGLQTNYYRRVNRNFKQIADHDFSIGWLLYFSLKNVLNLKPKTTNKALHHRNEARLTRDSNLVFL